MRPLGLALDDRMRFTHNFRRSFELRADVREAIRLALIFVLPADLIVAPARMSFFSTWKSRLREELSA